MVIEVIPAPIVTVVPEVYEEYAYVVAVEPSSIVILPALAAVLDELSTAGPALK